MRTTRMTSLMEQENRQYRRLLVLGFLLLLVPTLVARLLGRGRGAQGPEGHCSVFREAWDEAATYITYGFTGL